MSNAQLEDQDAWAEFKQLSILDLIKKDRRPTLVLDLNLEAAATDVQLRTVFTNAALFTSPSLLKFTSGNQALPLSDQSPSYQEFLAWARSRENSSNEYQPDFVHELTTWTSLTLHDRWRIISTIQPISIPGQGPDDTVLTPLETSYSSRRGSGEGKYAASNTGDSFFPTTDTEEVSSDSSESHSSQKRLAKSNADLLAKIAAFDTVAIYVTDIEGNIQFTNSAWHDITGFPRNVRNSMGWLDCFEDDEVSRILNLWRGIIVEQKAARFEARLKRRWVPPSSDGSFPVDFPVWISAWTYPDVSAEGETIGASGVMTEVSEQKWMETVRSNQLADAMERSKLMDKLEIHARELEMSEERFRRLTQKLPIAIFICNKDGDISYANDRYSEKVHSYGTIMSIRSWLSRVAKEDVDEVSGHIDELTRSFLPITFETRLAASPHLGLSADSSDLHTWFLVSAYPETDREGNLQRITGCMTDITHIKVAEEVQATRASDALAAKKSLEHFIDMTSHEIRNPLSATILSAKYIVESLRDLALTSAALETVQSAIESAETIVQCSDHSTRIVNDILTVSKLEGGLLTLATERVRPVALIENTLKMFESQMKADDIQHCFQIDQSLADLDIDEVFLDPNRVTQVLVNLLTNAIKFTRTQNRKEITFKLRVTETPPTSEDDGGIRYLSHTQEAKPPVIVKDIVYISIAVVDTGCGLSEAESKRLFTRFSQANKRTYVNYGGSGLGLYISRQLCEIQGGQIGIKSKKGEGSTFAFFVRARRAQVRDTITRPSSGSNRRSHDQGSTDVERQAALDKFSVLPLRSPKTEEIPSSHGGTILLVEDNLINQKVFSKALVKSGYSVKIANHGQEALDIIRHSQLWRASEDQSSNRISIVLLDVEMPVMDGLMCIRAIRKLENEGSIGCHVPVIAITANARISQISEAKAAGMDDVATKPFKMEHLADLIDRLQQQYPTTSRSALE